MLSFHERASVLNALEQRLPERQQHSLRRARAGLLRVRGSNVGEYYSECIAEVRASAQGYAARYFASQRDRRDRLELASQMGTLQSEIVASFMRDDRENESL